MMSSQMMTNQSFTPSTLSKDEMLQFYEKKHFQHHKFARYIFLKDNIKRINGQLHIYDGKCYVGGYRAIESKMVAYIPILKDSQRREVLKYLEIMCDHDAGESNCRYIAFENGVFDLETEQLLPFNKDYILTNRIPHNYNPQAYDENVDKVLDKLSKRLTMIIECTAYTPEQ